MAEPYIGEIRMFGFTFAPRGWALCNGQILAISSNTALFSILGTAYGGNGTSNFALPNLQGMVPLGAQQGPGLSDYALGETIGIRTETLLIAELPLHTHALEAHAAGRGVQPHNAPAQGDAVTNSVGGDAYAAGTPNTTLNPSSVTVAGGSQPHNNLMPTLVVNFCIAISGVFPARN